MESKKDENWERTLVEKLAQSALTEQRRKRRWGIFFKLLGFGYLGVILYSSLIGFKTTQTMDVGPHVARVELTGEIGAKTQANADQINASLRDAFEDSNTLGVILEINSPGGSPVQAGQINDEIGRLRKKYPKKQLIAVVDDICASGAYYVAAAADKIYVDKASLVGSIGVIMNGFGFTEAMQKLGVERRMITAGENKGFLDPFSKEVPYQTEFAKQMVAQIHQQFIDVVKKGRGDRLKSDPELFSGLVWTGEKSIELGLADATGSVGSVARDVFKTDKVVDYTYQESFAERVAKTVGVEFGRSIGSSFMAGMLRTMSDQTVVQ